MRRVLFFAALVATTGAMTSAHAQSTAAGQSLLITPGARADGMGRAFVAAEHGGPVMVWWNPGGLAFAQERAIGLMHTKLVPGLADDVYYEYLGYSQPLKGIGGFGANIIYLTYGKSTAVTDEQVELGEFTSYEVAGTASLGFKVSNSFGFGAALKVVYINLAPAWATPDGRAGTGNSFAVDVGTQYQASAPFFQTDQLNLAFVLTNLGPDVAFIDEGQSSPLGRIAKLGVMYRLFDTGRYAFRVSYDYNQPIIVAEIEGENVGIFERLSGEAEEPIQNMGGELVYKQVNEVGDVALLAAIRLGYIYDPDGNIKDPTFGLGFGLGRFLIDWAMVPQAQELDDNVHKFSLTAVF
jgi:hypothetical protein